MSGTLSKLVAAGRVAPDWAAALTPAEERLEALGRFLRDENAHGRGYVPAGDSILRAFERPLAEVRVLIVGQDPYPTPGDAVGLSFSVPPGHRPPPSLVNIFKELVSDLGVPPPSSGDLSPWADRGVLLLNRVLTTRPGTSDAHKGQGWEQVTGCAISALAARGGPMAAILWGSKAQTLKPLLGPIPWVASTHPSPLSANRGGFFGTRPFSRVNELLARQGGQPVDWHLP